MIKILTILLALTASAFAQSGKPLVQSGNVTPTHVWCVTTNGIAQDCGTAAIPFATTFGTWGTGPTNCAWTALVTSGAAQQICLGGTTSGGAEIYVQNSGTAPARPLTLDLNGTLYQFPFSGMGAGNVVGPNSSTVGDLVVWNNTAGTLVADSNVLPNGTIATTQTSTDNSANVATDAFAHSLGASPSALIGLSAKNGSATTYTRSDGAPALDQSIAPTWTGIHTFAANAYFGTGRPFCDPFAFGALGNNSHDDSLPILQCGASVNSTSGGNGGVIHLSPGVFNLVANSVDFSPNVITAASCTGTTITFTTTRNHGVLPGENFFPVGNTPSGYNGTFTAISGTTGKTLNATVSSCPGAETGLGQLSAIPILLEGSGASSTDINGLDYAGRAVYLDASRSGTSNLIIQGYNVYGASSVVYAALYFGPDCGECFYEKTHIQYGAGVYSAGSETMCILSDEVLSYDTAPLTITGTGFFSYRCSGDNATPTGSAITPGSTLPNWAATTLYATNAIVAVSGGALLQASVGGTSGGSSPSPPSYTGTVVDGTVTWKFFEPNPSASVNITASGGLYFEDGGDHSSYYTYGILLNGGANLFVQHSTINSELTANVYAEGGSALNLEDNLIQSCTLSGCSNVDIGASFSGDVSIHHNFINGAPSTGNGVGIYLQGGTNTIIDGNNLTGNGGYGVLVAANVNKFIIANNAAGVSAVYGTTANGITVASGTSNHYAIVHNLCSDASSTCVTDGGSGTDKLVGNTGYGAIVGAQSPTINNPTITGSLTASGQIIPAYGTPTIASGACGATTNGTLAAGATNQSGQVQIGSATTTGCAISFSTTLVAAPLACSLTPENAAAAATGTTVARVSAISTSSFTITGSALANANYYYHCF